MSTLAELQDAVDHDLPSHVLWRKLIEYLASRQSISNVNAWHVFGHNGAGYINVPADASHTGDVSKVVMGDTILMALHYDATQANADPHPFKLYTTPPGADLRDFLPTIVANPTGGTPSVQQLTTEDLSVTHLLFITATMK